MEQNRFRSPVLWTTVVSLVLGILMNVGVITAGENEWILQSIVAPVLELFAIFGILNNPTDKKSF